MNIPSISSASDSDEEDSIPIFSNFNWDQVEEPGFSGVSDNQRSLAADPPIPRLSPGPLSSASACTPPVTEQPSKIEPEPLIPSTSPHAEVSTIPGRLQSMGWFSGAAGRMADVFSPRSRTRLVEDQDTHQGSASLSHAQALTTAAAATAAETVAAGLQGSSSSAADEAQQEMLSARFHAMVEAHCIDAEQISIQDPLELEGSLEQVELSELDALIARLQAGAVMDLTATRPADLPDPSTLFSDDEGSGSDETGARSRRATAMPLARSSAAAAAAATSAAPFPEPLSAAQGPVGAGSAEAVTIAPQSPSSSPRFSSPYLRPSPSSELPTAEASPKASPRRPALHPQHLPAASSNLHPSGFHTNLRATPSVPPLPIHQAPVTEFEKPKPSPRPTVKVDLKASIASSLQQQQQQHHHHRHYHRHGQASTGHLDKEEHGAGSSSSYSGSRSSSSSAHSNDSDDSEDWAAMRRRLKAQGAQASGVQPDQPTHLTSPPSPQGVSAGHAIPRHPLRPKFARNNSTSSTSNGIAAAVAPAAASSIDGHANPVQPLPPKFSSATKLSSSSSSGSGITAAVAPAASSSRDGHANPVHPLPPKFMSLSKARNNSSNVAAAATAVAASSKDGYATPVQPLPPKFSSTTKASNSSSSVTAAAAVASSRDGHATPVQPLASQFASSNGSSCAVSSSAGGVTSVNSAGRPVSSTSTGVSAGTDGEDVGKATGATRSFFCCTDDLPPLEPTLTASHKGTGHSAMDTAVLLQQQQAQADALWHWQKLGSYISSSEESSSEDEGGGWRGAAAARPGARRVPLSNGHAQHSTVTHSYCSAQTSDIPSSQVAPPTTCTKTATSSLHPYDHSIPGKPSPPWTAPHQAPHTHSTPNKTFPKPGTWESNLPASSMGTPSSSAPCTPIASKMHTQTSTPAEQSRRPLHSTNMETSSADLDAEEGVEAQHMCKPRSLAYGLPKHAPGSSDAREEGVVFVQAGMRIRYPSQPDPSKPPGVQQGPVQQLPATADAGTVTVMP